MTRDRVTPLCVRCIHVRRATTLVNGKPLCRSCSREANEEGRDLVIAPVRDPRVALECVP